MGNKFRKKRPILHRVNRNELDEPLSTKLQDSVTTIKNIFKESDDLIQRDFKIGKKLSACCFYISSLTDEQIVEQAILKPLIQAEEHYCADLPHTPPAIQEIVKELLVSASVTMHHSFDEALLPVLSGDALLIIDGASLLFTIESKGFEKRGIEEPQTEVVIRGPRDGFTESLETNISLLRRRIKSPDLIVQSNVLGKRSKMSVALLYIDGLANSELIEELHYRLACIDTDDISESGSIEQLIEDNVLSPFPQINHTERPDKTVAGLLNGQVAILVEGTPFSLIAPITFHQFFKSTEDYYDRWLIGSLIRLLRLFAAFISLFLPALYIAMVSYHQGMIPTKLALSIAGSREGIPFPALIEAMLMEATFELLREAGNRLPRPIGQTVGIVGGIIIGDAAVRAGIVSPFMVIMVALTAIASFSIPSYSVSITFRILRFAIMLAAGLFGLFGITLSFICISIHLVGLKSFGSYYLSPLAPYRFKDWLDFVLRAPISLLRYRTDEPKTVEDRKQK
ncbi:spore germination protein [Bacillus horti]|uniref:Spore germination protein n=1 Tax=Caldalkalibacillus horti TaxID=77523 RepID=A0ABT9W4V9_9BACI|nr:spore germination protein [Bacillus horti]MDQ0168271.1 spore germination protein [Bacillus horti]